MTAPPGFRRITEGGATLVVSERFAADLAPLELTRPGALEAWRAAGTQVAGGRATSVRVYLPDSGVPIHLRPLAHGGWLRAITGRRFLGLARPLREVATAAALRDGGVRVPEPVFVLGIRRGPFWRITVGTGFVEPARALSDWLAASPPDAARAVAAAAAGRELRRFHDAGGSHADLHVGNLLVDRGDPSGVTIVDLDGARLLAEVTPARRMRELMRLARSLDKHALAEPEAFFESLLDGYVSDDESLKAQMLARMRPERFRNALHALGYPARPD